MNKRKRVAWRKHRIKAKKRAERQKRGGGAPSGYLSHRVRALEAEQPVVSAAISSQVVRAAGAPRRAATETASPAPEPAVAAPVSQEEAPARRAPRRSARPATLPGPEPVTTTPLSQEETPPPATRPTRRRTAAAEEAAPTTQSS